MLFFSIILPTYNRAEFISTAIKSVLNQSFTNFELLIIDDGSTDNTKEIVDGFIDTRIKYVYQENAERSAARNKGIELAKGEWICFLDSDDYFDLNYLDLLHNDLKSQNSDCSIVKYKRINIYNSKVEVISSLNYKENIVEQCLMEFRPIGVCEVICRKKVFEKFKFPEEFNVWEDSHLFYRVLSNFSYKTSNVMGYNVVHHDDSGAYNAEQSVDIKMIQTYINAINDLFQNHCSDLITSIDCLKAKKAYKHSKYQMFYYRAYKTNDYKSAYYNLKAALQNKSFKEDSIYYSKSLIKLLFLKLFKS